MTRCPRGLSGRIPALLVRPFVLALALVAAAAAPARAQAVAGRVVDPDQRPVAAARVLVLHDAAVVASTLSRADGRFGPIDLPAGTYAVTVAATGLRAAPRDVTVDASTVDLDVVLAVSAVAETVVVSAAQVDAPLTRVTDSVTVIDRDALDARQTETVADALRLVPGFAVVGSGGRGAITSVFPRGGESDYTLFLADGIPLNSFGGAFDAAHLPTAGLERVEVVRGPQSALHGSGAVGGVVQLVTRHGGPTSGRALVEGGGGRTIRTAASGAGALALLTWSGAFEHQSTEGDRREYPQFGGRIANDDYERWDVSGALGWQDGPARRVRVDVRHGRNDRGFPGPYGSDPDGLYGGIDEVSRGDNRTTGVTVSASLGSVLTMRHHARATFFTTEGSFVSPFGDSESDTRRVTARYQADFERGPAGLSAGVELLDERGGSTFVTGEQFQPVPVERSNTGLFVESRWGRGARASLTAGVRVERIARRPLEADPGVFNDRPAFDEDVVWSANPKVSATWFLVPPDAAGAGGWTKLRFGAGTGIKAPTAFEIAFTDNPGLRPERSRSLDAGVEQALAGATVLLDATWFANRYDDLIVTVGSRLAGASRYRSDNIANARAAGLELGATWHAPAGLRVRGAMTFLDTEVLAVDHLPGLAQAPFEVGDRLLRRAPRQGSIEVHWSSRAGSFFALVNGRSEMLDLEPNFASALYGNPGHVAVAVGGAVPLTAALEVFGRVTNLLDETYEDVFGFPSPGRLAFVGIRIAAGR